MTMSRNRKVAAALFAALLALPAKGGVIYNSFPAPQPANVLSLEYQASATSEFDDLIQLGGAGRDLANVMVLMSDWAQASTYGFLDPSWDRPLILNLDYVNNSGGNAAPGAPIASRTNAIHWRAEGDGSSYLGLAFTVAFDFTGITVPHEFIYDLAFNTMTPGNNPIGAPGPYKSLNFGLAIAAP